MIVAKRKALILLIATQFWESFSFYGMRVLLVLYLISQLNVEEGETFAIYALYTALIEIGAFLGAICADRYLGLRASVFLGGSLICLGHFTLTFGWIPQLFFLGLGFIVCGATLFRGNLKALVGLLYDPEDHTCEGGFTLFYSSVNVGGFLAAILCGYIAQTYGWHFGFGIAAIGMFTGMVVLMLKSKLIEGLEQVSKFDSKFYLAIPVVLMLSVGCGYLLSHCMACQSIMIPLALGLLGLMFFMLSTHIAMRNLLVFSGLLTLLIVYFAVEELMGSLLLVYCERGVDRNFFGSEIPSTFFIAMNPLIIMIAGPLLFSLTKRYTFDMTVRLSIAFICLGFAFGLFYFGAAEAKNVLLSFAAIGVGELFLAPTIYAYCSRIAPMEQKGLAMGTVTMAFALANLLSGQMSQLANQAGDFGLHQLFLIVFLLCLGIVACLTGYTFKHQTV